MTNGPKVQVLLPALPLSEVLGKDARPLDTQVRDTLHQAYPLHVAFLSTLAPSSNEKSSLRQGEASQTEPERYTDGLRSERP